MRCHYCKGERIMDNSVHGELACRVCLGTGVDPPYGNVLGHEAGPRELKRIAELVRAREAMGKRRARAGVELGAGIKEAIRVFDEALGHEGAG